MTELLSRVAALPIWKGSPSIEPLVAGLSNTSFLATDGGEKFFVRYGEDYPFHHVSRERELMVARAAHAAGFAPEVVYSEPGIMVSRYVEGRALKPADVKASIPAVTRLLRRFHDEMPAAVTGTAFIFWVFQANRDYAKILSASKNPLAARLPELLDINEELETAQVPLRVTFGHNDLLAANIIDDGTRLWLIDFEYAGFNTAMFDLANLASNAGFNTDERDILLEEYFGRRPNDDARIANAAMQGASLLREALWSLVSELYLSAPGADYGAYAKHCLDRFDVSLAAYRAMF
jgi:thiamine kinase-like enzyme